MRLMSVKSARYQYDLARKQPCLGKVRVWAKVVLGFLEVAEVIPNSTSGFSARISCIGFSMARQIMRRVG